MSDVIVEILTIIPSTDWFFGNEFDEKPLKDFEPVVCFALVTTIDSDHPTLGLNKATIPLSPEQFSDLQSLIGASVFELSPSIIYRTQITIPESDD